MRFSHSQGQSISRQYSFDKMDKIKEKLEKLRVEADANLERAEKA